MLKLALTFLPVSFFLTLLISCNPEQPLIIDEESVVSIVQLSDEPYLHQTMQDFTQQSLNGRTESAEMDFGTLDFTSIVKNIIDPDGKHASYSIALIPPADVAHSSEYFIAVGGENGYRGYILQYQTDADHAHTLYSRSSFTGHIRLLDFERRVRAENYFENGVEVDLVADEGGRQELSSNCECAYVYEIINVEVNNALGGMATVRITEINCVCDVPSFQGEGWGASGDGDIGEPLGGDPFAGGGGSSSDPGNSGTPDGIEDGPGDEIAVIDGCGIGAERINGICVPICEEGWSRNSDGDCVNLTAIMEELSEKLEEDPFLLLDIDCDQIENWQELAQHDASPAIIAKIEDLAENHDGPRGDWEIQYLRDAGGTVVNLDYFSVKVDQLPIDPRNGQRFTADGFQDYFRRNINDFAKGSDFGPYCQIISICSQETALWNSDDPTGAIMNINIRAFTEDDVGDFLGNDGVVVLSDYQNSHWKFMTLEAPYEYSHPVSGTRQFGYEQNADGSYNFFVRGVDRFTSNTQENVAFVIGIGNPFKFADELWEGFQDKLTDFINDNGGFSVKNSPSKNRPDWDQIREVLEGKQSINELGCK